MNVNEIRALLTLAMAYDNRKPGDAQVSVWLESARLARWTFDEARKALHAHYTESREFLMPAHITQRIRADRQDQALRAETERRRALEAPVITEEALRDAFKAVGWEPTRRRYEPDVLARPCTWCKSAPGEMCTRPGHDGRRITCSPHPSRVNPEETTA